ncbi:hypothetical protein AHAS_Ahas19G0072800 [Arachis hypogaea]
MSMVTSCKLWRQVGESFKPPKTCTTVSWTFRGFYEKALLDYERHKIKGGELSVPIPSQPEPMNIENQEKDSAEFPSMLGQDDSPLGSNSVVITNASIRDVQLESAHVQFSNSSDAQTLLEKEEKNTNSNILPTSVDRTEESPSAQALINDDAKEWNSPARYPTEMKREKRKAKSRPYWIQLVCCSSVDLQRRQKTAI